MDRVSPSHSSSTSNIMDIELPTIAPRSSPAQNPSQDSSISTLKPIEVQIKEQIAEQKAQWRKQRESLQNELKNVGREFDNLPWYNKIIYGAFYGVRALDLQVRIGRLSYLESTDTTALEAQMKKSIDEFLAEFDKDVVGNPDKKMDNPFDSNAPKMNIVLPVVNGKGAKPTGGGISFGKWIAKGAAFFFGEWLPVQFQISLYSAMK